MYCFVVELSPACPGMYRCQVSRICLDMMFLCDGIRQCPHGDDEKLCDISCPENCTCNNGYSVDCSHYRASTQSLRTLHYNTRGLYLQWNDLSGNLTVDEEMRYVIVLNMSECKLKHIPVEFIRTMRNLLHFDLSHNKLQGLRKGDFPNNKKLVHLDLTGNYELAYIESDSISNLISLKTLSIKYSQLHQLQADIFKSLSLSESILSQNQIVSVQSQAFNGLTTDKIDLRGNAISQFNQDMFNGVKGLKVLMTDAYKFCCIKPDSVTDDNCFPQRDEFSSCDDLMREEALKFLLWVIGFFALIGNSLSLIYRLRFDRKRLKLGYGIFVTNLAIADFLMGVYLLIIAVADVSFRGHYITWDDWWRSSTWCSFAGVISTISSEGSVIFICLITLDRIFVVKYPYGDIRFNSKTAFISSVIAWLFVIIIATVPLGFGDGAFYTRSAVCLALPLTRDRPAGWEYSTAVFIGFNFVVFSLIAAGQCLIFREIRVTSNIRKTSSKRRNDLVVARNLLLVVSTDFMCWFPIGVMGELLAATFCPLCTLRKHAQVVCRFFLSCEN